MGISFEYEGKPYKSYREFCNLNGYNYSRFMYNKDQGFELEQLVQIEKNGGVKPAKYCVEGEHFNSLNEIAIRFDISHNKLILLYNEGYSLKEAIKGAKIEGFNLFSKNFKSLAEIAAAYGINLSSLRRLRKTMESEEEIVLHLLEKEPVLFKGRTYPNVTALYAEYKKDIHVMIGRFRSGWDLETALITDVKKRFIGEGVLFRGDTYTSITDAYRSNGFSITLLRNYLAKIGTLEGIEFLECLVRAREVNGIDEDLFIDTRGLVFYGDNIFRSFSEFLRHCNANEGMLSRAIRRVGEDSSNLQDKHKALIYLKDEKVTSYIDKTDGEEISATDAVKKHYDKYKTRNSVIEHLLEKIEVPLYPNFKFDPNLKFIDFNYEVNKQIELLSQEKSKDSKINTSSIFSQK